MNNAAFAAFIEAIEQNDIDYCREKINNHEIDLDLQDGSALRVTGERHNMPLCKLLITNGASVGQWGFLVLQSAAEESDRELCALLLGKGIRINEQILSNANYSPEIKKLISSYKEDEICVKEPSTNEMNDFGFFDGWDPVDYCSDMV